MKHTLNCDINTQVGGNHEHCDCPCHKRIYGRWAGNPNGQPEDVTRCIQEIWGGDAWSRGSQCQRKRGHGPNGLYCKQHARMIERELTKSKTPD